MAEKGRQTPTRSYILPYEKSEGQKAIDLYNKTGKTAQEWQSLLLYDILAENEDGLYTHTKFGYSVPRRNGKNEIVAIREMYALVNGQKVLHTAHRTTSSHTAWERLLDLLELANVKITSSYRAYGKEHIQVEGGGKVEFRTRTSKGGLGEGFDLLVIDEAQEYQDDQESALKYVVSDSQNPQTIFCGTPPTPVSSGTVFTKLRENALQGNLSNTGWAEWSVEEMKNPKDKQWWYENIPYIEDYQIQYPSPVERNTDVKQVEVLIDYLYLRDEPSGKAYGKFATKGIYDVLEEKVSGSYNWYKIADSFWIASGGTRTRDLLPDKSKEQLLKEEVEKLKSQINTMQDELESAQSNLATCQNKIQSIKELVE